MIDKKNAIQTIESLFYKCKSKEEVNELVDIIDDEIKRCSENTIYDLED